MNLWQAIKLLKRRWWLIGLITGVVTGTVFVYFYSQPREWEGYAVIAEYRSLQANRTVIYPDPYSLQVDLITRLQNIANIVGSYGVLLSTWREIKDSGQWEPAERIKQTVPPNEQDFAGVVDLVRRTEIKPIPNTEYLSIVIKTQGEIEVAPRQAEYVMDVLLRKFQEQYSALNSQTARPSREFVEQEYQQAQREYERATRQLSEYLNQNKDVIQSDNQTSILLQSISRAEVQLYDAEVARQSAAARLARLTQQLRQEERRPGGGEYRQLSKVTRNNPILQQLQSDLARAQNDLQAQIAQGRGDNHPEVLRIKGRIEELERQISEQQAMILDAETTGLNNLYEALKRDYLQAMVETQVAEKRVNELRGQLAEMRSRLEGLPEKQRIAQELALKVQLAEGKVRLLKQKLDEALTRESELQTAGFVKIIDGPGARPVDKNLPLRVALAFALEPHPLYGTGAAAGAGRSGCLHAQPSRGAVRYPGRCCAAAPDPRAAGARPRGANAAERVLSTALHQPDGGKWTVEWVCDSDYGRRPRCGTHYRRL
jgi:uncharacterized protein involved in exopolysaccharide biosynthesis